MLQALKALILLRAALQTLSAFTSTRKDGTRVVTTQTTTSMGSTSHIYYVEDGTGAMVLAASDIQNLGDDVNLTSSEQDGKGEERKSQIEKSNNATRLETMPRDQPAVSDAEVVMNKNAENVTQYFEKTETSASAEDALSDQETGVNNESNDERSTNNRSKAAEKGFKLDNKTGNDEPDGEEKPRLIEKAADVETGDNETSDNESTMTTSTTTKAASVIHVISTLLSANTTDENGTEAMEDEAQLAVLAKKEWAKLKTGFAHKEATEAFKNEASDSVREDAKESGEFKVFVGALLGQKEDHGKSKKQIERESGSSMVVKFPPEHEQVAEKHAHSKHSVREVQVQGEPKSTYGEWPRDKDLKKEHPKSARGDHKEDGKSIVAVGGSPEHKQVREKQANSQGKAERKSTSLKEVEKNGKSNVIFGALPGQGGIVGKSSKAEQEPEAAAVMWTTQLHDSVSEGSTAIPIEDVSSLSEGMAIRISDLTSSETRTIVSVASDEQLHRGSHHASKGVVTVDRPLEHAHMADVIITATPLEVRHIATTSGVPTTTVTSTAQMMKTTSQAANTSTVVASAPAAPAFSSAQVCSILQPDEKVADRHGSVWMPKCRQLVQTNCSTWMEAAFLCPGDCPFLELTAYSLCGSACVAADGCGDYRPAYSFPNPETGLCERCPYTGCATCDGVQCLKCRDGFIRSVDGLSCIYDLDKLLTPIYWITFAVILVLAIIAGLVYFVRRRNEEALSRGLLHWARCLPHQVEVSNSNEREERYNVRLPLYSLTTNVHTENIVGVGLCLYYNQLVFVAAVAAVSWVVLSVAEVLPGAAQAGAVDWSAVNCGYAGHADDVVAAYARRRAGTCFVLWLMLFPASLFFAWWQVTATRRFNRAHTLMEDFVVVAKGFPPEATDPLPIQEWFESILHRSVIGISISYDFRSKEADIERMLDEHLARREAHFAASLGVPIDRARLTGPSSQADLSGASPGSARPASVESGEELQDVELTQLTENSEDPLQSTADSNRNLLRELPNSGEVFVVLRKEGDAAELFRIWDTEMPGQPSLRHSSIESAFDVPYPEELIPFEETPGFTRSFEGSRIELRETTFEPTAITWNHYGRTKREIRWNYFSYTCLFLMSVLAFNVLLYMPLITYVVRYAEKAGEVPSASQTLALGTVVGLGNSLIANLIWLYVPKVGFKRKDQSDIVVFLLRTLMVLWNSLALVSLTVVKFYAVASPEQRMLRGSGHVLERSEALGREATIAKAIAQLFITGTFVVPYLCVWLSYAAQLVRAVFVIRTGLIGSSLPTRTCEKWLEPMEIMLPWDYAPHIQLPCCAFFPLLFTEPPGESAARVLCGVLLLWCGVMYATQRVIHLRFSKETFFTTERLDNAALYLWAIPIAQLAHTSVYWTVRAFLMDATNQGWAYLLTFPALLVTAAVYVAGVRFILRSKAKEVIPSSALLKKPYEAALLDLRYSYFNTNPVYVLMSDLLPKWERSDSNKRISNTTYYEAGKVFLQSLDPKAQAKLEAARTVAELSPGGAETNSPAGRFFYQAQVWAAGAPQHAYQSLNDN